jgi:heme exporter protein D
MFDSFSDFFWSFMALSGFMFWICVVIFVVLLVIRGRTKKRRVFYE